MEKLKNTAPLPSVFTLHCNPRQGILCISFLCSFPSLGVKSILNELEKLGRTMSGVQLGC